MSATRRLVLSLILLVALGFAPVNIYVTITLLAFVLGHLMGSES